MTPKALTSGNVHETCISLIDKKAYFILDFGAGQGAFTDYLWKKGYVCDASDYDPKQFISKHATCYKIDANEPKYIPRNCYDTIFCINVFEHVNSTINLLQLLHTMLLNDGALIISIPNNENWYSRIYFLLKAKFPHFGREDKDRTNFIHRNPIFLYLFKDYINGMFKIEKITGSQSLVPYIRCTLPWKTPLFSQNLIIKLRKI